MSKKGKGNHKVQEDSPMDFTKVQQSFQTKGYIATLKHELQFLKNLLFQWSVKNGKSYYYGKKDVDVLRNYIKYHYQLYEYDQFDSIIQSVTLNTGKINLDQIQDEQFIYKSFNLFKKAKWPVRFDSKFVSRINDYNLNQIYYVLGFVFYYADGHFVTKTKTADYGYVRPVATKTISFNRFFVAKLFREKNMFIHVGVQKVPVVKQGVIKRYEYVNYMNFIDILGDMFVENKNKLDQRLRVFSDKIFNDVARKDHNQELKVDPNQFSKKVHYFYTQQYNEYTEKVQYYDVMLSDKDEGSYCPLAFQKNYISTSEGSSMVFDSKMKRWVSQDHLNYVERKQIAQYQKQINESLISRFVDFQSAKTLVELLTKIPNFKVNLTEQEKDVIGENGNVLAIGRSGTGKTTCAVLRLFSIEMLFKIRVSLYKKKYSETVKDVRCGSNDIDDALGLHCIFLTASPVLTHEIQRYYKKLTDNIKSELQKKKKKQAQKKKQQQQEEAKIELKEAQKEVSFEDLNQSSNIQQQTSQKDAQIESNNKKQEKNQGQEIIPQSLKKSQSQRSAQCLQQQKQMNEEFKGLKLDEDINNQNFDQKDQDIDEIKQKFEQNIKKFNSLFDLSEKDYPGFFTVKSFIMMIDGVMVRPFFIRNKNKIVNQDSKSSWHNENKGVMMIEDYYRNGDTNQLDMNQIQEEINYSDEQELENQYLRQIQLRENKDKQQLTKKLKRKNTLSFQVDYDYFLVHFWPRVIKKYYSSRNITPHLVWTQIYSTIKGSAHAHQFPGQYLSQNAYIDISSNTFLTKGEKLDIYETFCQYQRWKISAGGYDIMDTVNYILNRMRFVGYQGPEIHYVMIDEVQDLPHAIVYLLSKVARYGVFYSGDTAQTIAKGVGFRFCDLKTLFNSNLFDSSLKLKAPIIKHLTINFRSHNNILQLANSVVSSIQILFPKTIDRMKKEISDLSGPKPMILSTSDEQLLFYVLCGGQQNPNAQNQNAIKKSPLQFGCDQVIIVRDQQSKQRVPAMLQHALCLTIYQAKGLQFNDVILFNFFSECSCQDKWSLIKNLEVITQQIPKEEYQNNLSRRKAQQQNVKKQGQEDKKIEKKMQQPNQPNQQQQFEEVQVDEKFNQENNTYSVKKLAQKKNNNLNKDINDFAELCSELKLLYTAITRPRKTLIIYDDKQTQARLILEKIWQRLDVIELITKQLVIQSSKRANQTEEVKIFKRIVASTDSQSWKQQGLKMYSRGYFDQAMKCFERSGHKQLYRKAQANKNADYSTKKLIEIQSERNAIKQKFHTYQKFSSSEISKIKKKLKAQEVQAISRFSYAASIFQEMLMFKQAGQCYFSGKQFQKAFQCFCKAFMNKQAAQSLEMQNKFREAAQYYVKDQNYLKVIQCLDLINQWTLILQNIHKFAHKMTQYQKQALLKKYSALALEQLVYEIQFQNEVQEKKPENNRVEVIHQKQSDEEQDWDSDQDPELAAQRQYQRKLSEASSSNPSRKISEVSQQQLIEVKQSVYQTLAEQKISKDQNPNAKKQQTKKAENESSFSDLNDSKQIEQPEKAVDLKSIQKSFGELNQSSNAQVQVLDESSQKADIISLQSSFGDLNNLQPDIQSIKSLVDPQDLWVRNSISQIGHKLQSEYSVIDDEENYNINAKIIKTKGNIFVQDQIMTKIVNIVSIINSSVSQFFQQFKGYQSLITLNKKQQGEEQNFDDRPEISEFQDVDPKFINIILDTLQSFKLFKLCLFVCNRYHLPAKAGRYLLSLGLKYSTNCISNNIVNPILLAPSSFRKTQVQKGILASIALHAIYQNVNSDFLKIKVTQNQQTNKNSLGTYFIQGLILEGLYKKTIFMVNPKESFKILANYNDVQAYNSLYHQKILKKQEIKDKVEFPVSMPKTEEEKHFTMMLLRKVLFDVSAAYKFQSISLRYYREFTQSQISIEKLSQYKLPDYLPYTKMLIEKPNDLIQQFKKLIVSAFTILKKGNILQVLDFIGVFLIITHKQQFQEQLVREFNVNEFLQYYRCANHINIAIKKFVGSNVVSILDSVFFMHQCYRISYCKSMSFINDIYCFVHRTSTVANELVQNQKVPSAGKFAFFFEQDYNLILSKSSRVSVIILKKYQLALFKLYSKKKNFKKQYITFMPADFIEYQEQQVLKKALGVLIELMNLTKSQKKKVEKSLQQPTKRKELKNSYDFKYNGGKDHFIVNLHEDSQQSEQEKDYYNQQHRFYRANFNTKLRYLAPALINIFSSHCKHSKETVQGHQLYSAGLNNFYRQYTMKRGGFNLFDAIQFKKFNRVDLYAENVLSVIDNMTLFAKHNYIVQNLVLLMLQYRSVESPQGFSLEVTNNQLKYFQNIQFKSLKNQQQGFNGQHVNQLLINNKQCVFSYENRFVSQMNLQQLAKLICDYLQVLKEEEASQHVNFSTLVLSLVMNLSSDDDINESLRKIINSLAKSWKCTSLYYLLDCKGSSQYAKKRKSFLSEDAKTAIDQKLHRIKVQSKGMLKKCIVQSEFDYQVEGRIIQAKKKAAKKILKWWRIKRIEAKQKKRQGNYFEVAVQPERLAHARKKDSLKDLRLMKILYPNRNIYSDINFLLKTEEAKEELLSFLLTNTINSSLDFHFVLLSLNKIEECRQKYFEYCSWDPQEIHQFDIDEVKQQMVQMQFTIQVWKKDEKWLREKNINLKKKKVFEVKWMTKNLGFSGLLKKRAGLKRQEMLQSKKRFLKRMK